MPTILTHTAVPIATRIAIGKEKIPTSLFVSGIVASILPDFDVLAFKFGIPYGNTLGHRGFSHSVLLAGAVAVIGAFALLPKQKSFWFSFGYLFLCMVSHGLLDTLTTGGLGIALFWPFSEVRFFAPVRVIRVSPFGLTKLISIRGAKVFLSEFLWVWLPLLSVALASLFLRRKQRPNPTFNSDPAASVSPLRHSS